MEVQGLERRVAALEEGLRQVQDSPPLTTWDWIVRVGGILAVLLTVLRIRDHFANRARLQVSVRAACFTVRYTDPNDIYLDEHARPPEAANVKAKTSVKIDLEFRNTGRLATTFSDATLKTRHPVLATQQMKKCTNDLLLLPIEPVRVEPSDVTRVTLHSLLSEGVNGDTIPGRLYLTFVDRKIRRRLVLKRA